MTSQTPYSGIAIAGATASGKSALALKLAAHTGGSILNADSAQVYADLRLVSARPSVDDEKAAPHLFYGHVDGAHAFSAAEWARQAAAKIAELKTPIVVGGTGLYFRTLFKGLSPIPDIPPAIRQKWRDLAQVEPANALHTKLQDIDPQMAQRLQANDTQRIVRALEVFEATGRSLKSWQDEKTLPLAEPRNWLRVVLVSEREQRSAHLRTRFEHMVDNGAVDEVKALAARGLSPSLPVMKAIGVPELLKHVQENIPIDEAIDAAVLASRHYAKRQDTWFRTQMAEWPQLTPGEILQQIRG